MQKTLSYKKIGLAAGLTGASWHILGYIYYYFFFAESEAVAELYPLIHHGSEWLTMNGFIVGIITAFVWGAVLGLLFVAFYNLIKQ